MSAHPETVESLRAELQGLKRALHTWANSKTYEEGCANWRRLCERIGYDVATDQRVGSPESEEHAAA